MNESLHGSPIFLQTRNPNQQLNPENVKIVQKLINIDTRFRNNYYDTNSEDLLIDLPEPIDNVLSMDVKAVQIPNTIYSVDSFNGNNYFHMWDPSGLDVSGRTVTGPTLRKFVVENGHYEYPSENPPNLEIERGVNQAIEYDIATNTPITIGPASNLQFVRFEDLFLQNGLLQPYFVGENNYRSTIQFAFDDSGTSDNSFNSTTENMEIYFNLRSNATTRTDYDENPLQMKLGWLLGYRFGEYKNNVDNSGNVSFTSEGAFDPQNPRYLFLVVDEFNRNFNQTFQGCFNDSSVQSNVLAKIPIDTSYKTTLGPMLLSCVESVPRRYHGPIKVKKLRVQLLDPYGRKVNLNNMDYTISLQLNCLYN
jgi:hypothetical protein